MRPDDKAFYHEIRAAMEATIKYLEHREREAKRGMLSAESEKLFSQARKLRAKANSLVNRACKIDEEVDRLRSD